MKDGRPRTPARAASLIVSDRRIGAMPRRHVGALGPPALLVADLTRPGPHALRRRSVPCRRMTAIVRSPLAELLPRTLVGAVPADGAAGALGGRREREDAWAWRRAARRLGSNCWAASP